MDQTSARLRDMELHIEQYVPTVLDVGHGRRMLTPLTLEIGQVDTEPYPFRTPQTRTEELWGRDESRLAFLESFIDSYGLQGMVDSNGDHHLSRANPAGFITENILNVQWMGSRRQWAALGAYVAYDDFDHETGVSEFKEFYVPRKDLEGIEGFIAVKVIVQPRAYDSRKDNFDPQPGYTMAVDGFVIVPQLVQMPPQRRIVYGGTEGMGDTYSVTTYSPGTYYLAAAYVQPPGAARRTPRIYPVLNPFNLTFSEGRWFGSLSSL